MKNWAIFIAVVVSIQTSSFAQKRPAIAHGLCTTASGAQDLWVPYLDNAAIRLKFNVTLNCQVALLLGCQAVNHLVPKNTASSLESALSTGWIRVQECLQWPDNLPELAPELHLKPIQNPFSSSPTVVDLANDLRQNIGQALKNGLLELDSDKVTLFATGAAAAIYLSKKEIFKTLAINTAGRVVGSLLTLAPLLMGGTMPFQDVKNQPQIFKDLPLRLQEKIKTDYPDVFEVVVNYNHDLRKLNTMYHQKN